jgi:hypothetical protein
MSPQTNFMEQSIAGPGSTIEERVLSNHESSQHWTKWSVEKHMGKTMQFEYPVWHLGK